MKRITLKLLIIATFGILLISCKEEVKYEKGSVEHIAKVTNDIDEKAIASSDKSGDWLSYGRNYKEDRYSNLDQINKENLDKLGLAWSVELGTTKGLLSTPIVVDGIMFFSGEFNTVWAYDTRTGKEIWKYEHDYDTDTNANLCCGFSNRGLAIYKGDLFMGTLDGKLVSINASTGKKNWEVMTIPPTGHYSITGAPRVANGNIIIGNGGAEFDVRGYVTAYDAKTGKKNWRFYTVPGDPNEPYESKALEEAAKTWNGGEYWKQGGGGTVWDAIVYDPELNLVYLGVGNGTHWDRTWRSPGGGDNLYLSSIVALNADDGSYKWHYQTTPGDSWDYTATQPIILADLDIDGKKRKVLMQSPKNGFFYVIDRTNGEFISGNNYAYQNWTSGLDENGRPIEVPGARYTDGKVHWIAPSNNGASNWPPTTYNHETGLVYIPSSKNIGAYIKTKGANDPTAVGGGLGGNVSLGAKLYVPNVFDPNPKAPVPMAETGRLIAWDPIAQKEVWGVDQVSQYNGGLLSTTTGLLLQGDAQGIFSFRDVKDGKVLKSFDLRSGISAPPVTYMVDGEQFVTILVGWGGDWAKNHKYVPRIHDGTIYTFKLGGTAEMPAKLPSNEQPLTTMRDKATPDRIGAGWNAFVKFCAHCHPSPGVGKGSVPDLARSTDAVFNMYDKILLEGAFVNKGMPNMKGLITEQEIKDIKSFLFYSSDVLGKGMTANEYLTNIAKMQYVADTKVAEEDSSKK